MRRMKILNIYRILFFLIVYTSLFCFIEGCSKKPIFPQSLNNLQLVKMIRGEEAIKEVADLHGKNISIKDAWVAYYGKSRSNNAVVWISRSISLHQALKQTDLMMKKIMKNGNSPFHHLKITKRSNLKVFTFLGMHQKHAVFQKKTDIYWISASQKVFKGVLEHCLRM